MIEPAGDGGKPVAADHAAALDAVFAEIFLRQRRRALVHVGKDELHVQIYGRDANAHRTPAAAQIQRAPVDVQRIFDQESGAVVQTALGENARVGGEPQGISVEIDGDFLLIVGTRGIFRVIMLAQCSIPAARYSCATSSSVKCRHSPGESASSSRTPASTMRESSSTGQPTAAHMRLT